jgi:hypothetical protein
MEGHRELCGRARTRVLVQRVGTAAELAARAADAALAQREAHGAAAKVVARRTAAGGVLGAAREHGGAGRYGLASTMLTLELMQIDRVVEEWRHLVSRAFHLVRRPLFWLTFAYATPVLVTTLRMGTPGQEPPARERLGAEANSHFEALGSLMGQLVRLEGVYSTAGSQRMMCWGMLSHRTSTTSTEWSPNLFVLHDGVLTWHALWAAVPSGEIPLAHVLSVEKRTAPLPMSTMEKIATLGLSSIDGPPQAVAHALTLRVVRSWGGGADAAAHTDAGSTDAAAAAAGSLGGLAHAARGHG